MSKLFAMAIPILPDKRAQWDKFMNELQNGRKKQFSESRKKLGVRERTFLQSTPMGDVVIVTLEGNDPASAFTKFASGNDEFTKWFMEQAKIAHGIDLSQPPQGPMPEMVIDSAA